MTLRETLKQIRLKCLDCCCHQENEITNCPIKRCPLYKLRFGKNPSPSRKGNAVRVAAMKKVGQTTKQK